MIPDLPVELWLYIITMLPRSHLVKLVGINRTLFTLAMDERYQEVRFIDDGEGMLKTFHQLKYPSIARRVQRVYIRPGFFARMDEPTTMTRVSLLGRLGAHLSRLGGREIAQPVSRAREDILLVAQRGLISCRAVEELTITLHDLLAPPSFGPFLKAIWSSFAPNLRRLTVNATLAKFSFLLNPSMSRTLPHLTDLNINLASSRFSPGHERDLHAILPFINTIGNTIQSFTISSSVMMDITPLIGGLSHFPRLQKLGVHVAINDFSFKDPHALTKFIALHKDTLQHINLVLLDTMVLRNGPSYRVWVMQVFCGLDLPMLQSLEIGLSLGFPFREVVIPPLSSIRLSQLVSLTLSDAYMSGDNLKETFSSDFQGNRLESLQIFIKELNPEVLRILAERLPHLTSLDMTFEKRSVETFPYRATYDAYDSDFEYQMMDCKFPNWMLRNLKLSRVYWRSCPEPHYELPTMQIVARCFPSPLVLGVKNDCICADRQSPYWL